MWLALLSVAADAGRPSAKKHGSILTVDPAANASEIPALARLLERTGWTPTPEMSGAFRAGYVFQATTSGHRLQIDDCFAVPPTRSAYTAAEIVTQLQAGVSVAIGLGSVGVGGGIAKKMKFGAPEQWTLPELKMVPADGCVSLLLRAAANGADLSEFYVVQDVLTAEIAEQTCGRIDASGGFVALGSIDAELAMACSQESLEPVAIAYRTRSVTAIPEIARLLVSVPVSPQSPQAPLTVPQLAPALSPVAGEIADEARIALAQMIFFEKDATFVQQSSFTLLDSVAHTLIENPQIAVVHVEGHAGGEGTFGMELSLGRAEAVVSYLVRMGVDASRLVAKGYGDTIPIDSNDTFMGSAHNRRVSFTIEQW